MMGSNPRLSYAQLFSFQVSYSNHADSRGYANQGTFGLMGLATSLGRKKGEWKRAILEFDFVMETMFLQDKDRIVVSATFKTYRRTVSASSADDDNDVLLSIRFEDDQWEVMAQNVEERKAISHLLDCVGKNMSAEEASELGKKNGVIGVDKYIMKSGVLVRKAKTAYKKDERFVIIVPGKLLLFLSPDLVGKHVRYVTSLIGARVQITRSRMEFEVLVPNTKDLAFSSPSSVEGFTSWVKVIESSARGDTSVYSDDSDGYNDGKNYGNSEGAGWDPPHRSHRGGGDRSRQRAQDYYEDSILEDLRRGPAATDVPKVQDTGDDCKLQLTEEQRNWNQEQGQNTSYPRSRPVDMSYGQAQPYGEGEETREYQLPRVQDIQTNRISPQWAYNPQEQYGLPTFPRIQARTSRVGDNDTGLKEEDKWNQKQFKNVNTRRRSVPLQCLDSALDEMTASIGNMAPFQGRQPFGYEGTSNNSRFQSPKSNMAECSNDYGAQSSTGFRRSPLAGAAQLQPPDEDVQGYNDQSSHMMAGPKQLKVQGNDSPAYVDQSTYSVGAKPVQAQGNDTSSSYNSRNAYVTSPEQMHSQVNDSSSSYVNQSDYKPSSKQIQSQVNDPSSYMNQSGYTSGGKQFQLQGNNLSPSSYVNQSIYSPGLTKQMQSQGNNAPNSTSASTSQPNAMMNTYNYQADPHHNTNTAIDKSAPPEPQQSAALGKSTIAAGAIDWGGGRLIVQIDAQKKPPMKRSDTKAYGAIMGGALSTPPQFSVNTRMPMGGNSKSQPSPLQDPGTRPFQG